MGSLGLLMLYLALLPLTIINDPHPPLEGELGVVVGYISHSWECVSDYRCADK